MSKKFYVTSVGKEFFGGNRERSGDWVRGGVTGGHGHVCRGKRDGVQ